MSRRSSWLCHSGSRLPCGGGSRRDYGGSGALAQRVAEFERATLLAELERSGGHVTNAAKALGLERSHFYKKCQQLGIDVKAERGSRAALFGNLSRGTNTT